MEHKSALFAAVAAIVTVASYTAHATEIPVYKVTVLNGLGGSTSAAYDINDSGVVCGYSTQAGQSGHIAVVWTSATPTALSIGTTSGDLIAMGINNAGQVAGYGPSVSSSHAVTWPSYNAVIDWGTLGGTKSYARAINNNGWITGNSADSTGARNLFLKRPTDSSLVSLGIPSGDAAAYGLDIADNGTIVGYSSNSDGSTLRAFAYLNSAFNQLQTIGGSATYANGINNTGSIVVGSGLDTNASQRALYWTSLSSAPTTVAPLSGDTYSNFSAVNNLGWAVGLSASAPGSEHALLYIPDLGSYNLNDLKSAESDNITVKYATSINNYGQIIGVAEQQLDTGGTIQVPFIASRKLTVKGSVTLTDWMGGPTDVTVKLLQNGTPIQTKVVSASPTAAYTFDQVDSGNYEVSASCPYWITLTVPVTPSDTLYNLQLANGDADADGSVNLFDFVVLDSTFGTNDVAGDRDGSGSVNLFDYVIIDKNFGATGS